MVQLGRSCNTMPVLGERGSAMHRRSGASAVEYALILVFVSICSIAFLNVLGRTNANHLEDVSQSIATSE